MNNFFHSSHNAMNTRMDVIMWGCEESTYTLVNSKIHSLLEEQELIYSRFLESAEVFHVNKLAAQKSIKLSNPLWETINLCIEYSRKTMGYYNIAYLNNQGLKLQELIELKSNNQSIKYKYPNIKLDFGGIGKGIALTCIERVLKENAISNALLSFGESSVLTRGKHPHGEYWPFAFQEHHKFKESLKLNNNTVSISGLHGDTPHIVDPNSGSLISETHSVCIVNNNPVEAEVLSTALIAAPKHIHQQIIQNFNPEKVLYSK